jgi:hypothetical protein
MPAQNGLGRKGLLSARSGPNRQGLDAQIFTHRHNHQVTEKGWMSSFLNALSTNFIFLSQIRVIGETESSSNVSYQH